jgi:hypothetical protein
MKMVRVFFHDTHRFAYNNGSVSGGNSHDPETSGKVFTFLLLIEESSVLNAIIIAHATADVYMVLTMRRASTNATGSNHFRKTK